MDTAYVTLSRQSGLMNEMRLVANNIANANTTGYRQQGLVFSEFIRDMPNSPSLSMSRAEARNTSLQQGVLTETGGSFDFAIEGDGFFMPKAIWWRQMDHVFWTATDLRFLSRRMRLRLMSAVMGHSA